MSKVNELREALLERDEAGLRIHVPQLKELIEAAKTEERERCAEEADAEKDPTDTVWAAAATEIAHRIRGLK